MDLFAQILGVFGLIFNILVFQQKKQNRVLICQFFAASFFALNYFLLGAVVGGLLNLVGVFRSIVFYFEKRTKATGIPWLIFFIIAFASSYPITFFVFDTPMKIGNFIIELLPVVAMIIATVSLRTGSAKAVRYFGLLSSPMWLTYNCFSGSIGAIASEILNLISIVIVIIRLDIKRNKNDTNA